MTTEEKYARDINMEAYNDGRSNKGKNQYANKPISSAYNNPYQT